MLLVRVLSVVLVFVAFGVFQAWRPTAMSRVDDAGLGEALVRHWLEAERESRGERGQKALHLAVAADDAAGTLWLLKSGAHVNVRDKFWVTPLHHARSRHVAKLLLEWGAFLHSKSTLGQTPLQAAVARGIREVVMAMICPHNSECNTSVHLNRMTPLGTTMHFARDGEMVNFLIGHGAEVDSVDRKGRTALLAAAEDDNFGVVLTLLESNANVSAVTLEMNTALHLQARIAKPNTVVWVAGRNQTLISVLLQYGADVNAKNEAKKTPLHLAVAQHKSGQARTAELLAFGADVNAIDVFGRTPIFEADPTCAGILVEAGAELEMVDSIDGQTIMHWKDGQLAAAVGLDVLLAHGVHLNASDKVLQTPLHVVRNEDFALALIAHGAAVNAVALDGSTPLHRATSRSMKRVVAELLQRGADVNARDLKGWTALLDTAVQTENRYFPNPDDMPYFGVHRHAIMEMLLSHGADANAIRGAGCSPLHYAVEGFELDSVRLLMRFGARPEIVNAYGQSPFDIACLGMEKWLKKNVGNTEQVIIEGKQFVIAMGRTLEDCARSNNSTVIYCRAIR